MHLYQESNLEPHPSQGCALPFELQRLYCDPRRTRTFNQRLKRALLCQLSYRVIYNADNRHSNTLDYLFFLYKNPLVHEPNFDAIPSFDLYQKQELQLLSRIIKLQLTIVILFSYLLERLDSNQHLRLFRPAP